MGARDSTDAMPLDDGPLSKEETIALRRLLLANHRAGWMGRQLVKALPFAIGIVTGLWQAYEWLRAHVTFK